MELWFGDLLTYFDCETGCSHTSLERAQIVQVFLFVTAKFQYSESRISIQISCDEFFGGVFPVLNSGCGLPVGQVATLFM